MRVLIVRGGWEGHRPVAFGETAGVEMPMAWVREHGAGRVFVSTLGHGPEDLAVPQARTLTERGLLWAARVT